MARISQIKTRDGLSAAQEPVFNAVAATRGEVRGPFSVLLHKPEIADGTQQIGAYLRYGSSFPGDVRESVILAVARLLDCAYEWSAHRPVAVREGVSEAVLASLEAGRFADLTGDIGLAVEYASSIVTAHGVPAALFARAAARWSEPELVEITAMVGYYTYLALVMNTFEVNS